MFATPQGRKAKIEDELKSMGFRTILGAVLVASMASPTNPASATPLSLGAHNTIRAVRDGSVEVFLPRDVSVPLKVKLRAATGPAPWITLEGGGRATGIVLVPRTSNAVSDGLVATQFRSCRRGCRERPVNALMVNGASYHGTETLPAGDYRLYVFTDGEDVTIDIEFPQLTGQARIDIGGPGFADIRTPVARLDYRDEAATHAAKASFEMNGSAGVFMAVNVMRDENYKDASFDECLSPDHVGPDEVEQDYCLFPTGAFRFVRPLDPTKVQPKRGGFVLTTFVGLNAWADNPFNGDSSRQHYSFRVISPGPLAELWSQGVLLSF